MTGTLTVETKLQGTGQHGKSRPVSQICNPCPRHTQPSYDTQHGIHSMSTAANFFCCLPKCHFEQSMTTENKVNWQSRQNVSLSTLLEYLGPHTGTPQQWSGGGSDSLTWFWNNQYHINKVYAGNYSVQSAIKSQWWVKIAFTISCQHSNLDWVSHSPVSFK